MKIKITDMSSLQDMIKSLILNHYKVTVEAVYKEWPEEDFIDYYIIQYKLVNDDVEE